MQDINESNPVIEKVRLEYLAARAALLARHTIGDKQMCARGRVYNALAMATTIKPTAMQLFKAKFDELAAQAEALIEEYNTAVKAYGGFCAFGAVRPEWEDLPTCDCAGCKTYAN